MPFNLRLRALYPFSNIGVMKKKKVEMLTGLGIESQCR